MEIDLKILFKSKELYIKDNYNMSNLTSENFSDEVNTSNRSSISFIPSKLKTCQIDEFDLNGYKTKQKKIELLKKYIHILDIISSLIIIISEIICQIENENFSDLIFI